MNQGLSSFLKKKNLKSEVIYRFASEKNIKNDNVFKYITTNWSEFSSWVDKNIEILGGKREKTFSGASLTDKQIEALFYNKQQKKLNQKRKEWESYPEEGKKLIEEWKSITNPSGSWRLLFQNHVRTVLNYFEEDFSKLLEYVTIHKETFISGVQNFKRYKQN